MKNQQPENLKRRGFLLAAGVGSAGAVAAVAVATNPPAATALTTVKAEVQDGGYQETRHISNYYRTARV